MISDFYNYWVVIILMMIGFYIVISDSNLIKKIIGLTIFQTSVFILFISMSKVDGGTAPILIDSPTLYSNPLPHVLILTAIVVGCINHCSRIGNYCKDTSCLWHCR